MVEKHLLKLSGNGPHQKPGSSAVTVEDVHVAVAFIQDKCVVALLRALYGGDESGLAIIHHTLATKFSHIRRWRKGTRERLAKLAVDEFLYPITCGQCGGAGKLLARRDGEGVLEIPCELCEGKGFRRWSNRRRAKCLGISHQSWGELYSNIYDDYLIQLTNWKSEGQRAVHKSLHRSTLL